MQAAETGCRGGEPPTHPVSSGSCRMFPVIHLCTQAAQLSPCLALLAVPTACSCLPAPAPGEAHCPQSLENGLLLSGRGWSSKAL